MTKLKNQIATKLKTQTVMVVIVTVIVIVTPFSKNKLTPRQPMKCSQGSFLPQSYGNLKWWIASAWILPSVGFLDSRFCDYVSGDAGVFHFF